MMKELKTEWEIIVKGVKGVTQKIQKIIDKLDKLEKSQDDQMSKAKSRAKGPRRRNAKKATQAMASGTVLDIIRRNREGVDITGLKEKTGLVDKEIRGIVFNLRREGKIKRLFVSK